jgi:hypothetical protein
MKLKGLTERERELLELKESKCPPQVTNLMETEILNLTTSSKEEGEPGCKHDIGKLQYSLLPFESLREIAKALTFGAEKYKRENWKKVEPYRFVDALFRHIEAWRSGEINDPETKIHHLGHAGCNLLFLLWFELRNPNNNKL